MKIQHKIVSIIALFGIFIIVLLSFIYNKYNNQVIIDDELERIGNLSEEIAFHLDTHLKSKITIAQTLGSIPQVKKALYKSNLKLSKLTTEKRKFYIDSLNKKWMEIENINNNFIQDHMNNSVAFFFKSQQLMHKKEYGEIFLTNRYGVMIATTGKLTTLAHAHKYWWLASNNFGKSKVFLDDRGFDNSAKGYVLGIVTPIIDNNKIIGILKSNVNLDGPLTNLVREFSKRHYAKMKIVRSEGLVISETGVKPLSKQVSVTLTNLLKQRKSGVKIILENNEENLVAFSSIPITLGSKQIGFGGKDKSIDHIKGNKGETWNIVVSLNKEKFLENHSKVPTIIIISGIVLIFFISIIAIFIGRYLSKPIIKLTSAAQIIGDGNLDFKIDIHSNDEIGYLANSMNKMAKNLQETMISRNKFEKTNHELEKTMEEMRTLKGIIPICSYCHKIRDDVGSWSRLEAYISKYSDATFSHGMCPECYKKEMETLKNIKI